MKTIELKKCKIKDMILISLIHNFELNNKRILLYQGNSKKEDLLLQIFPYNLCHNPEVIKCIKKLENDGFIVVNSDDGMLITETKENNVIDSYIHKQYYCEYITELGKIKIRNGGFVKEYNDARDRKREKIYARITLFVLTIYTIATIYMAIKK